MSVKVLISSKVHGAKYLLETIKAELQESSALLVHSTAKCSRYNTVNSLGTSCNTSSGLLWVFTESLQMCSLIQELISHSLSTYSVPVPQNRSRNE